MSVTISNACSSNTHAWNSHDFDRLRSLFVDDFVTDAFAIRGSPQGSALGGVGAGWSTLGRSVRRRSEPPLLRRQDPTEGPRPPVRSHVTDEANVACHRTRSAEAGVVDQSYVA